MAFEVVYEYTPLPISRKYSEKFKFAFMSLIPTPGLSVRQRSAIEPAPTTRGSMMMKFVLFLALSIAALAIIAAFAVGGENSADGGRYDYRASSDQVLPFARPPRTVR